MAVDDPEKEQQIRQRRIEQLLESLGERGISQNEIAQRVGVPASYVTSVKNGHRTLTELFARRLAEEFRLDYRWLLGAGTIGSLRLGSEVSEQESANLWLPTFSQPVQGSPRSLPEWDGSCIEVCGAAAGRARAAVEPYALRFIGIDHAGRLRPNDLVLVSQSVDERAEIHIIKARNKMFLARQLPDHSYERIAERGYVHRDVEVVGHLLGIVWACL